MQQKRKTKRVCCWRPYPVESAGGYEGAKFGKAISELERLLPRGRHDQDWSLLLRGSKGKAIPSAVECK